LSQIVSAIRAPIKPLARIDAEITVLRENKPAADLSPTERLLASYAVANQSAAALAENGHVTRGHRAAMHAHLVCLINRETEREVRQFVRLLAAEVGLECRDNGIPADDEPVDLTDWETVTFR
jgi:hypothetical protein